jgi:uncharacterized tellurite resistance protein B-like protein
MAFPDGLDPIAPSRLDRLRVAFAATVARDICDADGVLDMTELDLLGKVFPDRLMRSCGFVDANGGLTPTFEQTAAEAPAVLRTELGLALKLELVTVLHDAAFADGVSEDVELELLEGAALKLGVSRDQLQRHLSALSAHRTLVPTKESRGDETG